MNITTLRIGCSNCNLREVCMPLGLTLKDMETVEELVSARRRIRRGEALYRAGDYFNNLYVVRLGFLKSTVMSSDGREQVTNFFMAGEMIGLDGISSNVYSCDVVALEDTEVCVLPFDRVEQATTTIQTMGKHFQKLLSREIVRQHGVMLLLGSMHAEERLAAFLLSLSQRFENRGYSRSEFVLRMTRAEIGSYLGLKLETVSRVLSRFSHDGLIEVNQKHVRIFDPEGLRAIVSAVDLDHSPSPVTDAGSTVQDCAMASAIVRSVCTQAFPLIVPCGTSADMAGAASAMRSAAASAEILVFMVSLSLMNVRAHRDSGRFTRRAAGASCQE